MKSFLNVFSNLDKIVRQTVIRLFKLTDFFPGFYKVCVFARRLCTNMALGSWTRNSVFFRVLRQQFGYFLGVLK